MFAPRILSALNFACYPVPETRQDPLAIPNVRWIHLLTIPSITTVVTDEIGLTNSFSLLKSVELSSLPVANDGTSIKMMRSINTA